MPPAISRWIVGILCFVCLWAASAVPAYAQWYVTYDDALKALSQRDWKTAEEKLRASKQQAQSANTRPGRSVLRQGGLFEPFLPDFYLSRAYFELARNEKDTEIKRGFLERAVASVEEARKTNQVRANDPENSQSTAITTQARAELEKLPPIAGGGGGTARGGGGNGRRRWYCWGRWRPRSHDYRPSTRSGTARCRRSGAQRTRMGQSD